MTILYRLIVGLLRGFFSILSHMNIKINRHKRLNMLAILAFAGYGHTHRDGVFPEYVDCLRKAVNFMKSAQVKSNDPSTNGRFGGDKDEQWIYDHAIATMAMAELPVLFSQGFHPHPRVSFAVAVPVGIAAGVGLAGARWLSERGIFAAGSDTVAFERLPSPRMEVHVHLLVDSGVHIIENLMLAVFRLLSLFLRVLKDGIAVAVPADMRRPVGRGSRHGRPESSGFLVADVERLAARILDGVVVPWGEAELMGVFTPG